MRLASVVKILANVAGALLWDTVYAVVWLAFLGVRIGCALGLRTASNTGQPEAVARLYQGQGRYRTRLEMPKRLVSVFAVLLLAVTGGRASDLLIQLGTVFPGDTAPAGPSPWVDAIFHTVNPGTVLLTITNVNVASGEFIDGAGQGGVYLNLNPSPGYAATQLVFTPVSSTGNYGVSIATGENAFKSDGDGYYDIQFSFSHAFSTDASVTYQITGIAGLTASDFAYLSSEGGGEGIYYAAAHVQGLSGGVSTWIGSTMVTPEPVPEPSTLGLTAIGAIAWLVCRRNGKATSRGQPAVPESRNTHIS